MSQDTERIRVGEEAENGEPVEMPVIDLLAGRGFITGKSGSGKSNTASVVAEQLLEAGYGLLIVDVDGEYYGLKEEYELLHAGADEECDIRVSPEHAEKLATLALEENVPIILDVSSYLDPDDADEMLLAVARQLFAKAKKQKKPFLVLVEECHEYIPEGGGMTETGKMLIKIGKRGRKHGLGIVGMSQRPADVKKDFITQCDWMVWHRLTWDNDTRVVGRILGSEYGNLVEDLGDGEAFLTADWSEELRRVQFDRKRTFDAGATPGLEEFERPELQSVSDDLVADLQHVSEERERHESELASLEAKVEKKEQRIAELEAELAEARDMSEMADRFAQALVDNADESPAEETPPTSEVAEAEEFVTDAARDGYPGAIPAEADDEGRELLPENQRNLHAFAIDDEGQTESNAKTDGSGERERDSDASEPAETEPEDTDTGAESAEESESESSSPTAGTDETTETPSGLQPVKTISSSDVQAEERGTESSEPEESEDAAQSSKTDAVEVDTPEQSDDEVRVSTVSNHVSEPSEAAAAAEDAELERPETAIEAREDTETESTRIEPEFEPDSDAGHSDSTSEPIEATGNWPTPAGTRSAQDTEPVETEPDPDPERTAELKERLSEEFGVTMEASTDLTGGSLRSSTSNTGSTERESREESQPEPDAEENAEPTNSAEKSPSDAEPPDSSADDDVTSDSPVDPTADRGERFTELIEGTEIRDESAVVQVFVHGIEALDNVTRGMLAHYRTAEKATPVDAHVAAGGSGERQYAYARNRTLRTAGLVEHAGGGRYRYRLQELVTEVFADSVDEEQIADTVAAIESAAALTVE